MRALMIVTLALLGSGCTITHDAASYRAKYAREPFLVEAPYRTVVDRTVQQASDCMNTGYSISATGGATSQHRTAVMFNRLSATRSELLVEATGKAATHGMTTGSWRTFSVIADFEADGQRTRVQPYSRGRLMTRALRRWALDQSPACPNYEL